MEAIKKQRINDHEQKNAYLAALSKTMLLRYYQQSMILIAAAHLPVISPRNTVYWQKNEGIC